MDPDRSSVAELSRVEAILRVTWQRSVADDVILLDSFLGCSTTSICEPERKLHRVVAHTV